MLAGIVSFFWCSFGLLVLWSSCPLVLLWPRPSLPSPSHQRYYHRYDQNLHKYYHVLYCYSNYYSLCMSLLLLPLVALISSALYFQPMLCKSRRDWQAIACSHFRPCCASGSACAPPQPPAFCLNRRDTWPHFAITNPFNISLFSSFLIIHALQTFVATTKP